MTARHNSNADLSVTGVPGFDLILAGGLPKDRIYLVQGSPGAGKTTFALQFLMEGLRRNEAGLYITLSETKEELLAVAKSHGWSLEGIHLFELSVIQEQIQAETENTFFHPSEVELAKTTKVLLDEVERVKPARVVFDSLSEMRLMSETPLRFRRQILRMKQFFSGRKSTVLCLDDLTGGTRDLQIESIVHGVISLSKEMPEYGVTRRTLNIEKLRGAKYREGYHDFVIRKGGISIFPRLIASEHPCAFTPEVLSSGIDSLDTLLGGGLERGTSTIFMGPPGTGKSTLAAQYVSAAAARGQRVVMFTFDEMTETLVGRAHSVGIELKPHLESGTLRIMKVSPAQLLPGELSDMIWRSVEKDDVRMVVIDSLNGYLNAMPGERFLNLQLHEMLAFLNQRGVLTIMVLAQQGLISPTQSDIELTYLADSVLLLRHFELLGEVKQAVSITKKRSSNHERFLREFRVDKKGIRVGGPLKEFQGILTGVPEFRGRSREMIKI